MNADVLITVLKKTNNRDFLSEHADSLWPSCEVFSEGQEFLSKGAYMPEQFCSWAWVDIQRYVLTLSRGGNFLGVKSGTFITCCTDGFRPVFFLLKRI